MNDRACEFLLTNTEDADLRRGWPTAVATHIISLLWKNPRQTQRYFNKSNVFDPAEAKRIRRIVAREDLDERALRKRIGLG